MRAYALLALAIALVAPAMLSFGDLQTALAAADRSDNSLALYHDGPKSLGDALQMEYVLTEPDSAYCKQSESRQMMDVLRLMALPPNRCGATVLYSFLRRNQMPPQSTDYRASAWQRAWTIAKVRARETLFAYEQLDLQYWQVMPVESEVDLQTLDRISKE